MNGSEQAGPARVFASLEEFAEAEGEHLGVSDWYAVDQDRIDLFARATDDEQWIHVDPERAAEGPFGTTIAHGFLTLSLLPQLLRRVYRIDGLTMAVNYGLDKVRFPAPVPVGSELRASTQLAAVTRLEGSVQAVLRTTLELKGSERPACVVESIARYSGS